MSRLRHRIAHRLLAGAVWLGLIAGQAVALVHAAEHAEPPASAAEPDDGDAAWGHDAGSSTCVLVDHLLGGQLPAPAGGSVSADMPAGAPAVGPAWRTQGNPEPRACVARGPPGA